jgi:hypothetical protein
LQKKDVNNLEQLKVTLENEKIKLNKLREEKENLH